MKTAKCLACIFSSLILSLSYCANASAISDAEASRETEIPNLRVTDSTSDVVIGYVENHTRLGKYSCGGMTLASVRESARVVESALSLLPPAALAKAKPKYIILCSKAMAGGQEIGGIPMPPLNLLMLNTGGSFADTAYGKHIVLHELYHLVEYRFGTFNDADWNSRFGRGYANSYSGHMKKSALGDGRPDFIDSYGETFPHEERAELFSFLLIDPDAVARLMSRNRNPTLEDKVVSFTNKCNTLLGTHISLPGM